MIIRHCYMDSYGMYDEVFLIIVNRHDFFRLKSKGALHG
jgi:hypothetical protein